MHFGDRLCWRVRRIPRNARGPVAIVHGHFWGVIRQRKPSFGAFFPLPPAAFLHRRKSPSDTNALLPNSCNDPTDKTNPRNTNILPLRLPLRNNLIPNPNNPRIQHPHRKDDAEIRREHEGCAGDAAGRHFGRWQRERRRGGVEDG